MISSDGNQNNIFFLFLFAADRHFVRFSGRRYRPPYFRIYAFRKTTGGDKLTPPLAVRFLGLKEVWGGSKVASTKRLLSCLAHFDC